MYRHIINLTFFGLLIFITSCDSKHAENQKKIIKVGNENSPATFDPRLVRDLETTTYIHNLFEGLMRKIDDKTLTPAMAERVEISDDQKTYTFQLRECNWSNGDKVTAHDFMETWKTILDSSFPAPNAYQLYVIKNGQAVKEGTKPVQELGVKAEDDQTLVVELEHPTAYFLDLTATYFFYPVHKDFLEKREYNDRPLISNGPFQLKDRKTIIPNEHYWAREKVKIDEIQFVDVSPPTALNLFEMDQLDWAGSPQGEVPVEAIQSLKAAEKLKFNPTLAVYFLRINTHDKILQSKKIRLALALAINRFDIVEHALQGSQQVAEKLVPPNLLDSSTPLQDNQPSVAKRLFLEALQEQNLTLEDFPTLKIAYSNSNDRGHKVSQVLAQQWKKALGINVELQSFEAKILFSKLKNQDYQIAFGSWFADFSDPISFLEVFKYRDNGTNNTNWENPEYIDLLNQSGMTTGGKRNKLLQAAEVTLLNDLPIIPLFFSMNAYLKKDNIKDVYFSGLSYLDFTNAYVE